MKNPRKQTPAMPAFRRKFPATALLCMLFMWLCIPEGAAQKGLCIAPILNDKKYTKDPNSVVVIIKGEKLKPYHLTFFHSIAISDWPREADRFEKAVLADGKQAENSEEVKDRDRTLACYYQLPPVKGPNRFILFRRTDQGDAVLIYLEGYTELHKLIKTFINKKK